MNKNVFVAVLGLSIIKLGDIKMKVTLRLLPIILVSIFVVDISFAYTAQEIIDSAVDEMNDVTDYTADADMDCSDTTIADQTGCSIQWKRASDWKMKYVEGTPGTRAFWTDGTNKWNLTDSAESFDYVYYNATSGFGLHVHDKGATYLLSPERAIDSETGWTKQESTETINTVECYKIYTDDYVVWIDVSTRTKVMKVQEKDTSGNLVWSIEYEDYSSIEGVQLPQTITADRYSGGSVDYTLTYDISSIDINETLSDSIFSIDTA